jgi:flagellar hook-associated protein 3 FlgL
MTRIADNQTYDSLMFNMSRTKARVDKYSKEVSTGTKVVLPSDSPQAGVIADLSDSLVRIDGHEKRVEMGKSFLSFQEQVITQSSSIIVRAKELASQMANEVHSVDSRRSAASEVWGLRNQLANLGNATYQGRYIYGGIDDDDPPFDQDVTTYATFGSADSQTRYVFDQFDAPPTITNPADRQIQVTDTQFVKVSTNGSEIFSNALASLEKLGRALEGYRTDSTTPDYTQLTQPDDYSEQSQIITSTIDELESARVNDIQPEVSSIGERIKRLELAGEVLASSKTSVQELLGSLRDADITESATNLSLAQTALQASYAVTTRLLQLSILDYV